MAELISLIRHSERGENTPAYLPGTSTEVGGRIAVLKHPNGEWQERYNCNQQYDSCLARGGSTKRICSAETNGRYIGGAVCCGMSPNGQDALKRAGVI